MRNLSLLVTGPFDEVMLDHLWDNGFVVIRAGANLSASELKEAIADVDGYVLGGNETLTTDVLECAKTLRIIVLSGQQSQTLIDDDVIRMLGEAHIKLENTPGISTDAVADMACGLILCSMRKLPYLVQGVQSYDWPDYTGAEIAGKTLGIYGMGKIGYSVAERMSNFRMGGLLYTDTASSNQAEASLGARRVDLQDLCTQSDILSIHAPFTLQTEGIISHDLLHRMKHTAVLINTARAGIVDPGALRRALAQGWLSCAAFDGYYVEGTDLMSIGLNGDPYGLLEMRDKFFATSHQGFNTRAVVRKASEDAAKIICSFFSCNKPWAK